MTQDISAQKKNNWVGICLFVSLAVNIFLAGVVFGRKDDGAMPRGEKIMAVIGSLKEVSPESRAKAKELVKADWPKIQEDLKGIRAKRQEVRSLLEQPAYDSQALEQSFADLRGAVGDMQTEAHKLVVKIAAELSPEERVAFMKSLPKPGL
jgi:uncharacterized membrane protein